MAGKRILVCGGRDFADLSIPKSDPRWEARKKEYLFVFHTINSFMPPSLEEDMTTWLPPDGTVIISGMARGADSAAVDWSVSNWVKLEEYPADWNKYGKRAGYIRNTQMLEEGKPDMVIAFPGGRGTEMMCNLAEKKGVPVYRFTYNG